MLPFAREANPSFNHYTIPIIQKKKSPLSPAYSENLAHIESFTLQFPVYCMCYQGNEPQPLLLGTHQFLPPTTIPAW